MYTQKEAAKEIRLIAKENGLTFKKQNASINNNQAYMFVQRGTDKVVLGNQTFWVAYENCMNGYIQKITNNSPKVKPNSKYEIEEYEICGKRVWMVYLNGNIDSNTYLDECELEQKLGSKIAKKVIESEPKDHVFFT